MTDPLISVLLPVFNCEKYIEECISSILAQSFTDFELLIFNDGSNDTSLEKIYKFKDNRIKIFNSPVNVGYVKLLNQGIFESKGQYIVRMDADDVCIYNRFSELIKFMNENLEIGVCGSYVKVFGDVKEYIWRLPLNNKALQALLPFRIPFIHPSVIIRKKVLMENGIQYKNEFLPAEDYELWCNLSRVTKFANIPKVLLKYRQHQNQISKEKKSIQQNNSDKVRYNYYKNLFLRKEDYDFYTNIVNEKIEYNIGFLNMAISIFKELETSNKQLKLVDEISLKKELSYQLFKIATHLSSSRIATYKIYRESGYCDMTYVNRKLYLKYILKSIFLC